MTSTKSGGYFGLVLLSTLGSFTYGFNASIMGTVFGLASFYTYFNLDTKGPGKAHANNIIAATQGLFAVGGIVGCCIVAWAADRFGRKRMIQVITLLCVISAALQAGSVHIAMLLVARFLNGMGSGMINVTVPLLQSEIVPAHNRGRMVGFHGFLLVSGYAAAGWTGLGCYFEKDPQIQWRLCLALQITAPLLLFLGSPMLLESPRWLIQQEREEEAKIVLRKLRYGKANGRDMMGLENETIQADYHAIHAQLQVDNSLSKSLWASFKDPIDRRRWLSGLLVQCLAQSTGVLVINNYQVLLYNGLGLYDYLPLLLYAVYASWAAVLNLGGAMIVDWAGRIKMLSIGLIGCALSVACETAMVAEFSGTQNKVGNGFGVFFLFVFVTFYATCIDPISYVYCSEIFPTHMRARGVGLSVIGLFSMTLIYTQSAPVAFAQVGWKFYLLFVIVPLVGVPVLYFGLPETKGLTLEEIGILFGDLPAAEVNFEEKGDSVGTRIEAKGFGVHQSGEA